MGANTSADQASGCLKGLGKSRDACRPSRAARRPLGETCCSSWPQKWWGQHGRMICSPGFQFPWGTCADPPGRAWPHLAWLPLLPVNTLQKPGNRGVADGWCMRTWGQASLDRSSRSAAREQECSEAVLQLQWQWQRHSTWCVFMRSRHGSCCFML